MRSIEDERQEAADYAIRAAQLEDHRAPGAAQIFHELVKLCDRKIELLQQLDERRALLDLLTTNIKASALGDL